MVATSIFWNIDIAFRAWLFKKQLMTIIYYFVEKVLESWSIQFLIWITPFIRANTTLKILETISRNYKATVCASFFWTFFNVIIVNQIVLKHFLRKLLNLILCIFIHFKSLQDIKRLIDRHLIRATWCCALNLNERI